jgi:5-formyltetrahydrofolate cyclo-ligase
MSVNPGAATDREVKAWRRRMRHELRVRRVRLRGEARERSTAAICDTLAAEFTIPRNAAIGFYWPIRGEVDLVEFVTDLVEEGARAALPVVVAKKRPVEFHSWYPGAPMVPGAWRIPEPRGGHVVVPDILLVPLLGFDLDQYRLGNGGGYYDRTLGAMDIKPYTIGVGFDCLRLETIYPFAHDVPLDAIVTESGVRARRG